jgi:hypothetical protein
MSNKGYTMLLGMILTDKKKAEMGLRESKTLWEMSEPERFDVMADMIRKDGAIKSDRVWTEYKRLARVLYGVKVTADNPFILRR